MKKNDIRITHAGPLSPSEIRLALPLLSQHLAAGFPSPADDHTEQQLDLNELLIKHPAATFYVRVQGDSMTGAGIQSGDILIVDRAIDQYQNKIVVAYLNGEFTIKRLYYSGKTVSLLPENEAYPSIIIGEEDTFEIWGVVTFVIHSVYP